MPVVFEGQSIFHETAYVYMWVYETQQMIKLYNIQTFNRKLSRVAMHCLHNRKADPLSLNPVTAQLPGLSPERVAILP